MLAELVDIALQAGVRILDVYAGGPVRAARKSDDSPVTEADTAAEAVIAGRLRAIFPGVPIVAEEMVARGQVPASSERFFLVDPLDGTKEFLIRNGEFTVNIALVERGRPTMGVVHAPALGLVYAGSTAGGAWRAKVHDGQAAGWRSLHVRETAKTRARVLVSRSHLDPATREFVQRLSSPELVALGSALKFCRLAEGAADIYPRFGPTMEWDTAAGDIVLTAAGGVVRTSDGGPLTYGKRNRTGTADFANPAFVASGAGAVVLMG